MKHLLHTFLLSLATAFLALAGPGGARAATAVTDSLADGYYRIRNSALGGVIKEHDDSLLYWGTQSAGKDYSEIWHLTSAPNGRKLQNVLSGRYVTVAPQEKNQQYKTSSDAAKAGAFPIVKHTTQDTTTLYLIHNDATKTYGFDAQQGSGKVLTWMSTEPTHSQWAFIPVGITADEESTLAELRHDYSGIYRIHNANQPSGTVKGILYEATDHKLSYNAFTPTGDTDRPDATWIVKRKSAGLYTMQNVATGRYARPVTGLNERYDTQTGTATFAIRTNSTSADGKTTYYNLFNDANKAMSMNAQPTSGNVVAWNAVGSAGKIENGEWTFSPVSLTTDQIRQIRAEKAGYASELTDSAYYEIVYGPDATRLISARTTGTNIYYTAPKTSGYLPYTQYWRLVKEKNSDAWKLQNVYTSEYLAKRPGGSGAYVTSATGDAFYITTNPNLPYDAVWNIKESAASSKALNGQGGTDAIVGWSISSGDGLQGCEWGFRKVTLKADSIASAKAEFASVNDVLGKADQYAAALKTFFADSLCTTLKADYTGMTDEQLTAAIGDRLPAALRNVALKVKNDSWAKYEKRFRVAPYKVFSNYDKWAGAVGNGYVFSRIESPTGISVDEGDMLFVVVGDDVPENSTLYSEIVGENASTGSQTALKKGLNIFRAPQTGNIFISYHGDTYGTKKLLRDFPDLNIHFAAGGKVNGYFDLTKGDNDATWKQMQQDSLFKAKTISMRSRRLVWSMDREAVIKNCPEKMVELMEFWDSIAYREDRIIGLSDKYIDSLSLRFNNIYGCYSVNINYMYATNYGTYYHTGTLSTILNFDTMHGSNGAIWGPAHEMGHLRQNLINIVGDTEVSNNLLSNICVWERGRSTTRGNWLKDVFKWQSEGKNYLDYSERLRMYWQLYLYYHVVKGDTTFLPRLFTALRKDPMKRTSTVSGNDNYLKFARKCCEVSGDDLTEFFRAWGFFVPVSGRHVDDYAQFNLTTTQADIDSTLAYMKQFRKGAENIIFIEDRIKPTPASYVGAPAGTMRQDYSNEWQMSNPNHGNVGSFTDFADGSLHANGYTFSLTTGGDSIKVNGDATGAVGYKVYDKDGNVVLYSNLNTFALTDALKSSGNYVVKAAQSDGTEVEMPDASKTTYKLTVYYGTATPTTIYSSGRAPEASRTNALYVVDATSTTGTVPTALRDAPGVLTAGDNGALTTEELDLADLTDFYAPNEFSAKRVTYSREGTEGWNSLCLPFAISASDLGEGARLMIVGGLTTDDAGNEGISLTATDRVEAGQPCLVYCPDGLESWKVNLSASTSVTNNPNPTGADGLTFNGSFTNHTIGAGAYKLNAAGTAFGITKENATVAPFRMWLDASGSSLGAARRIAIFTPKGEVTGLNDAKAEKPSRGADLYDLSGRKVTEPVAGKVYILGGQKVIFK